MSQAIGAILNIEDVQQATENSERVLVIEDDSDLEEAANFDI